MPIGWCYFPIEFLVMQNHVYLSIKFYDGCIIFWNMVDGYRWLFTIDQRLHVKSRLIMIENKN